MLLWLRDDKPCLVPPFASHQVGVAGVVVDAKGRLLLVKDRAAGPKAQWKLPGGLTDLGEEIGDVAEREVLEETGIKAKFSSLLAFRHQHGMSYGRSDLYFMCLLKPTSEDQQIVIGDAEEISDATWMDAREYIKTTGHPMNKLVAELALSVNAGSASPPQQMVESTVYIPSTKKTVRIYTAQGAIAFGPETAPPSPLK